MEILDSGILNINKNTLSLLGLWVNQKFWQKILLQFLAYFMIISTLYFQISFLQHNWKYDLDTVFDCCSTMSVYVMCFGMFSVYVLKQKKLSFFVKSIENDWKLWASKHELSILEKHTKIGRNYNVICFQYNFSAYFLYLFANFSPAILDIIVPLNESRSIDPIYREKFSFDEEKYSNYILLHQVGTNFFALFIFCTIDCMFSTTIQHACGLFAIVRYRMKNIYRVFESTHSKDVKGKKLFYKELFFTIKYHYYAIRYAKELESFYSPFLLISNGINILTISFPLVQTSISVGHNASFGKQVILSVATTAHVYLLGIPSQNLINQSTAVAYAIYDCEWYELPIKIKKLVIFIIMNGHIPCHVTVGKIAVMNMETVAHILKLAFSYFTMLSAVNQSSKM